MLLSPQPRTAARTLEDRRLNFRARGERCGAGGCNRLTGPGVEVSTCQIAATHNVLRPRRDMPDQPFAYTLTHEERGWTWRVYDEDGETVAAGAHASQSDAQAAVEQTIRLVAGLNA